MTHIFVIVGAENEINVSRHRKNNDFLQLAAAALKTNMVKALSVLYYIGRKAMNAFSTNRYKLVATLRMKTNYGSSVALIAEMTCCTPD